MAGALQGDQYATGNGYFGNGVGDPFLQLVGNDTDGTTYVNSYATGLTGIKAQYFGEKSGTLGGRVGLNASNASGTLQSVVSCDNGTSQLCTIALPTQINGSFKVIGTLEIDGNTTVRHGLTVSLGAISMQRCSGGSQDGNIVVNPSTLATACTTGGGILVDSTIVIP